MEDIEFISGSRFQKNKDNCLELIQATGLDRYGLDCEIQTPSNYAAEWDFNCEEIIIDEKINWLSRNTNCPLDVSELNKWIVNGPNITTIEYESNFCDTTILKEILNAKNIFNVLDIHDIYRARAKANPFETIKSVFFMNRAALKMANIDSASDFMFTEVASDEHHKRHRGPFYFADVCAGPGGFTEYILWRKSWLFKGFGFTLKGESDFNLSKSICSSPVMFNALYGSRGDGNIYYLENILHFKQNILHETKGEGVHFMMADGGFSVEGYENLQEILSKQLYICQCLMALEIVRSYGHFVTKLFDTYSLFSIGIIFLMSHCFEKVAIFKPNASRPANSERYLICQHLITSNKLEKIREYFRNIVQELLHLKADNIDEDVNEIVPLEVIKADKKFFNYIFDTNIRLGKRQLIALRKITAFCYNPLLTEPRQAEYREKCLKYWKIPDYSKAKPPDLDIDNLLLEAIPEPKLLTIQSQESLSLEQLKIILEDPKKWHYVFLNSYGKCHFYAAVRDGKVYRLINNKWTRIKTVYLVKGTILYGEMVNENVVFNGGDKSNQNYRQSLHVIDALRLGDAVLENVNFSERSKLINIYCEAVNHESRMEYVRIRAKDAHSLNTFSEQFNGSLKCNLSVLGLNSCNEYYDIQSVLLLKTDQNQTFSSTHIFRIQIFVNSNDKAQLSLDDLSSLLYLQKTFHEEESTTSSL